MRRLAVFFVVSIVLVAGCGGVGAQAVPGYAGPLVPDTVVSVTLAPYMGMRVGPDSAYPSPLLTPGAINASVTDATLAQTICLSGWTKTVRAVNEAEKQQVMQRYGYTGSPSDVEIDHYLPLEDGGSNAVENLWPMPYQNGSYGARVKDKVETRVKDEICAGRLSLADGQNLLTQDWVAGYERYFGSL